MKTEPRKLDLDKLTERYYMIGVETLVITASGISAYKLQKPVKLYTNHSLAAVTNLIIETRDRAFLDDFGHQKFIIAVTMGNTEEDRNRFFYCCYGTADDNDHVLLAFTDLVSFDAWNQGGFWQGLEVEYWTLNQIRNECGIIINPGSENELFLDKKYLDDVEFDQIAPIAKSIKKA